MEATKRKYLEERAKEIRRGALRAIGSVGSGHVGGSLSLAEVLAVLYFEQMRIDPERPDWMERDRLVISKGHGSPAQYAAMALRGYFPEQYLDTLNAEGTDLPSHGDMLRTPGIDMSVGSLGQGLSCAVGMAIAARLCGAPSRIYAIIGDGESQEGQIWEAVMYAAQQKLANLTVLVDYNRMQISGLVEEVCNPAPFAEKFTAFGFAALEVDGHDVEQISGAIRRAQQTTDRPTAIILHTVKGKGVSFIEEKGYINHSMPLDRQDYRKAIAELR